MRTKRATPTAVLLIHCPDQTGIVASVTDFLFKNNGNIIDIDEHVDKEAARFFMRVEWEISGFSISQEKIGEYFQTLIGARFKMEWQLHFSHVRPRMAVFVSKMSHCLFEILYHYQSGEWNVDIPLIISNHENLKYIADRFEIPFHLFEMTPDNKAEQEARQIALLREHQIDFVVLARYMQIISSDFIAEFPDNIINIHHSFLPAFIGAKPYHQAYQRGVKIIGATSHFVTEDLDAGPIIAQEVVQVTHRDSIEDLVRKGKDVEKIALSRALWHQIRHKVLVYNNRTIIFE
jgi:formyltetrahydrofolate deformylase